MNVAAVDSTAVLEFTGTLDRVGKDASWKTHVVDRGHDVMMGKRDQAAGLATSDLR
jgi:hypothetical protein